MSALRPSRQGPLRRSKMPCAVSAQPKTKRRQGRVHVRRDRHGKGQRRRPVGLAANIPGRIVDQPTSRFDNLVPWYWDRSAASTSAWTRRSAVGTPRPRAHEHRRELGVACRERGRQVVYRSLSHGCARAVFMARVLVMSVPQILTHSAWWDMLETLVQAARHNLLIRSRKIGASLRIERGSRE